MTPSLVVVLIFTVCIKSYGIKVRSVDPQILFCQCANINVFRAFQHEVLYLYKYIAKCV